MSSSSDQWMQFENQIGMEEHHHHHQQVASSYVAFSDATAVTRSAGAAAAAASESMLLSLSSTSFSPKGYVSKPVIRRKSRASKKTPTTLLNADTENFRALVQQFTGCPSSGGFSFGSKTNKGPVDLNFGLANDQTYATTAYPDGNLYYGENHQQVQVQPQQQQQVCQEEQQCLVSFDNNNHNNDNDVGYDAFFCNCL